MTAKFSFFPENITAISFYWRHDTPTLCHLSSSPNQLVPEIVSPLPCSDGLVRHTLPFVYFFKGLNSFIGLRDVSVSRDVKIFQRIEK